MRPVDSAAAKAALGAHPALFDARLFLDERCVCCLSLSERVLCAHQGWTFGAADV
jgi:hypothetical protein